MTVWRLGNSATIRGQQTPLVIRVSGAPPTPVFSSALGAGHERVQPKDAVERVLEEMDLEYSGIRHHGTCR
jgi:hypothetical protein